MNASCSDQLQKSLQSFQPLKCHHGKHALAALLVGIAQLIVAIIALRRK
jgi:hypothetical protein